MIARAPGKLVLSGAYAVLEGAPAVVTAVDRYAVADTLRAPSFVTPEVHAALSARAESEVRVAPWFDASELREQDRKLGLGSSAAILVASLGALAADATGATEDVSLRDAVLLEALEAHARAQGGGSGVDVAASAWGGTIVAQRRPLSGGVSARTGLEVIPATLPPALKLTVFASPTPASTPELLGRVRAFSATDAGRYRFVIDELTAAAIFGAEAVKNCDAAGFVEALRRQLQGLSRLGNEAGAPIVTPEVAALDHQASAEGAVALPAGAGGGDVAFVAGKEAPSPTLVARANALGLFEVGLRLGARGVHATKRIGG